MSRRVLVTGATGFVGANLVRRLLADHHDVHVLVRPQHHAWRLEAVRPDVQWHAADLTEPDAVKTIIERVRPEWIFNLAAHGAYSWQLEANEMIATNLTGTLLLLEACARLGFLAFVQAGSSSEYGFKDHAPDEAEALSPNSYYAVTKASATLLCRFLGESRQLPIRTLRLYSVYGRYEEPRRLFPTLVVHAMHGRLPPLVNPETARDYVYVDDVCDAFIEAADSPGQEPGAIYNIGSGVQTSLRQVVEVARRVFGLDAKPEWGSMAARSWDTQCWVSDPRSAATRLGWRSRCTLEQGLSAMAAWFATDPAVTKRYEDRILGSA
ncbi:MAG: NAD-dependent epimerase/dehydratase family protein [Chloroflexi bacterium]|nr:MAG: NAD-dependent epimerase/dehydratase family protein [Chloroflexota bacterium]